EKQELVDRWSRQLRAAADAGFALDGATAEVLPGLLDAVDRALERRFRTLPAGMPAIPAASRRAALQSSLLGDFLFDSALEKLPDMSVAEQRLLSDALAHGAVEVLVKTALEREAEQRQHQSTRLARLTHDLRNSVTAARLAMDLLKRKGTMESRAGRALENSIRRLRDGIEDSLLDDVLYAGGLRISRVRLAPMLADAHSAAADLGAHDDNVKVVYQKPPRIMEVHADPRVVRPAV